MGDRGAAFGEWDAPWSENCCLRGEDTKQIRTRLKRLKSADLLFVLLLGSSNGHSLTALPMLGCKT